MTTKEYPDWINRNLSLAQSIGGPVALYLSAVIIELRARIERLEQQGAGEKLNPARPVHKHDTSRGPRQALCGAGASDGNSSGVAADNNLVTCAECLKLMQPPAAPAAVAKTTRIALEAARRIEVDTFTGPVRSEAVWREDLVDRIATAIDAALAQQRESIRERLQKIDCSYTFYNRMMDAVDYNAAAIRGKRESIKQGSVQDGEDNRLDEQR